jgi:hypothetical protein
MSTSKKYLCKKLFKYNLDQLRIRAKKRVRIHIRRKVGSGTGSPSNKNQDPDPDPHPDPNKNKNQVQDPLQSDKFPNPRQNDADPQHCQIRPIITLQEKIM